MKTLWSLKPPWSPVLSLWSPPPAAAPHSFSGFFLGSLEWGWGSALKSSSTSSDLLLFSFFFLSSFSFRQMEGLLPKVTLHPTHHCPPRHYPPPLSFFVFSSVLSFFFLFFSNSCSLGFSPTCFTIFSFFFFFFCRNGFDRRAPF